MITVWYFSNVHLKYQETSYMMLTAIRGPVERICNPHVLWIVQHGGHQYHVERQGWGEAGEKKTLFLFVPYSSWFRLLAKFKSVTH